MKKLCCLIIILLLTGCGNKLVCTNRDDTTDYTIDETVIFKFDDSEIKNGKYILKLHIDKSYKDYLSKFKNSLILEYTNLYDIGVKRKVSIKDNNLNFVLKYDSSKFNKEEKEQLIKHGLYEYGNYGIVKNELEKDGYECN